MFPKITISILFLVLISGVAEAGFAKNIPGARGESVIQTSDGGHLVTGIIVGPDSEFIDSFIYKLNRFGNQVFRKRFRQIISTAAPTLLLEKITEVNDGYIVAGSLPERKIVLIKLDIVGTVLWTKSIAGTAFPFTGSLASTSDGGFILSGNFAPDTVTNLLLAIKFNPAGEIVWRKRYNFKANASSIGQTDDGGFLIGAGPAGTETDSTKFALIRLNSNGGIRWKKILTIAGANVFGQLIQLREGGSALVASNNDDRVHIIRFNDVGGIVWSKFYGESLGSKTSIAQVADGGLVVGAETDGEKALVFKLDDEGNVQWTLSFGKDQNAFKNVSISPTLDGGSVTTGWMLFNAQDYAFIVKVDPTGVTATCGFFTNPVVRVSASRFNVRTKPIRILASNVEVTDETLESSTVVTKVKNVCP